MGRAPKCSDAEFIQLFETHGAAETAKILQSDDGTVRRRRRVLEARFGKPILSPRDPEACINSAYPTRIPLDLQDGVILVGSDAHYWPDEITSAHRAFVKLAKELQPKFVFLNGDVVDGARISRHPRIMWNQTPTLKAELQAVEERTQEIMDASKEASHYWMLGNHDMRFETKLADGAPEYEGITGFSLREHFPKWKFGLSSWVNDSVVIKHRWKNGVHATHNNALNAGKTMVTGHLHSLKVTPFSDYNGTRFGVDTGTLSNPYGEHAAYGEDNPLNHRSGFIVLTFHKGKLLWPEPVRAVDEKSVEFRGQIIEV